MLSGMVKAGVKKLRSDEGQKIDCLSPLSVAELYVPQKQVKGNLTITPLSQLAVKQPD